ncbi:protein translocase subunit SecD [Fluviicola taffensis]|uniref:Multifunctional fusion protein n=1 Tax=Fluviicola taffensis (strain DSM 16823 / NCIMB 13979 / RW262) TaxID=755732 RepID=F2IIN5_FLUTR|nr:protein translocase subunit SecD [Fluviicola taffensis]AEA45997.1 protein-export membrane protein SecD [Fluviicola taffensis DSM 16823]
MRNKGFFWFLTILLTAVCVYQLSFTWVTINVENEAEREALGRVEELKKTAALTGDSVTLSNGTTIDFNKPESFELAKAAMINLVLSEKAEKAVYPVIGTKFKDVKARSLAFGLDLVGGMSVTMEIDVPKFVETYARNKRDLKFKKAFDAAYYTHTTKGGDFVDLFISEFEKENPKDKLVRSLAISEVKELSYNSSNSDVASFFHDKIAASMDGVELIMSKRINQFGVAQPNIQKESRKNRLYIELPGVQDEATVAEKLQSTANLQFFETYSLGDPGIQAGLTNANIISRTPEIKKEVLETASVSDTSGLDTAKVPAPAKPLVAPTATGSGIKKSLFEYLKVEPGMGLGMASAENKEEVNAILKRSDIVSLFPENLKFMWSANLEDGANGSKAYVLYAVKIPENGKAEVGGEDIRSAVRSFNSQTLETTVSLTMSIDGSQKWGVMTGNNINRSVAITMDDVVYSAPVVRNAINGGSTEISGDFSIAEADDLAGLLNGGSLPAPCIIKEQTKVGPTIGKENSESGLVSFAFAFLAVFIYMYFYYGKGGLVANIALAINVILIFGCLASFGAVLTLAGIAGIVLTIGTAVDANILIFERIKEENALGKSAEESVNIGFIKALPSIIDANVAHLLVAMILKIFGTGEIESFATTLIVGIFTSVFSAIIISKLIITSSIEKGKKVSFSTKYTHNMFSNFHFDWIGKRKYFYIFSITVSVLGIAAMATRGLKQSVEFTGGRTFGVKMQKAADTETIRKAMETYFVEKNGEKSNVEIKNKSNSYNVEITTNYLLADAAATAKVEGKMKEAFETIKEKTGEIQVTDTRSIMASVSEEMWSSATLSITLALIAIFAYIFIRFGQWQYSLGAILGLAHDVLFVLSVFALLHGILPFSLDVNQAFIAAVLTVIGYSMNDTVIVFDRIRESLNFDKNQHEAKEVINDALNKTLSRTFNTSMILFVVLLIMFLFGGPAIKGFLFALLIGVVIGTYSSLCVATPILMDFTKTFKVKKSK